MVNGRCLKQLKGMIQFSHNEETKKLIKKGTQKLRNSKLITST